MFAFNDMHDILGAERFKIQAVCRIVVRRYRFRVVVYDHDIIAEFSQRPDAVDGRVIEFDALADPDRSRAENDDHGLAAALQFTRFAIRIRRRIEIRGFRRKLRRTGIDHLIGEPFMVRHL